jgi:hypothetical protein
MIPIVIQKYHCSAFNSILFSEMIKTWQTQTDRQSFYFIWSTKKCIFQKCNTLLCYSLPSCLLLPRKKNESDQFPKKISNPSSSETMHHGVWKCTCGMFQQNKKKSKFACTETVSYLVADRLTTLSNSSFAK